MSPTTLTPTEVSPRLTPEDKTAINTYLLRLEQLERANDWQGLLSLMTPGCTTLPPRHAAIEGRQAWLQWLRDKEFSVDELNVSPLEFDGCGDLAFVRCNYRWTYRLKGRTEPVDDSGKFLGLLRKQLDGKWLATHWMWNSDVQR
jgi:ketosteroid isomerase-like protein